MILRAAGPARRFRICRSIRAALERHRAAVLTAAPGAGKTTRVPPALVDRGRVLLLQPRRVAARAMARRIADERGWTVGREIGWHIRFERQFTRGHAAAGRHRRHPDRVPAAGSAAERRHDDRSSTSSTSAASTPTSAWRWRKQAWLARADLRIVVMSATLDTAPVSAFLGGCPIIDVPGTLHPLTVEYAPGEVDRGRAEVSAAAHDGQRAVLPAGAREIARGDRRERRRRSRAHESNSCRCTARSMRRAGCARCRHRSHAERRIIVATNIAETSLTVPACRP